MMLGSQVPLVNKAVNPNLLPLAQPHLTAPLEGARRDSGWVCSRATLTTENIREGSSVIRQLVVLSFVKLKVPHCAVCDRPT